MSVHWYLKTISAPADASISGPFTLILVSFGLFFELVFPQSPSEGSRPHMQGRPGGEGEEEEESNLETKPIDHTSGQSAERQLPKHLQGCQETVVGRLQGEWQSRVSRTGKEE